MLTRLTCVAFVVLLTCSQIANCSEEKKREFTKFLKCDLEKASLEKSTECPPNSRCIDIGKTNPINGWCICGKNYTVNENYSSAADTSKSTEYCIDRNSTSLVNVSTPVPPTTVSTSTTTQSPQTTTTKATAVPTPLSSSTTQPVTLKTTTTTTTVKTSTVKVENATAIPSTESTTTKNKNNNNKTEEIAKPQAHHFIGGIMLPLLLVLAFAGVVYSVKKYDLTERAQTYIRNRRAAGQPHQTRYDGLENDFDDDPLLI